MVRQETGNRNNKTIHRITLVLTSCLAFVLLFACSAIAAENNAGAAKNPNATYFLKPFPAKRPGNCSRRACTGALQMTVWSLIWL